MDSVRPGTPLALQRVLIRSREPAFSEVNELLGAGSTIDHADISRFARSSFRAIVPNRSKPLPKSSSIEGSGPVPVELAVNVLTALSENGLRPAGPPPGAVITSAAIGPVKLSAVLMDDVLADSPFEGFQ
jgi:hypothetical protein